MNNIDVAKNYYKALYKKDFARVRSLASASMRFSDPTVSASQALPTAHENLDDFLVYMEKSLSDDADFDVSITDAFESNSHVVLYVTSKVSAPEAFFGGSSNTTATAQTKGITVLVIEDGKIQSHTDYFDYHLLARSLTL